MTTMKYDYKQQFRQELVTWYERERRDLPWRHTKNPYKIWVSEVMLQQTRVETVIPYYNRFLEAFPNAESFAYAEEEKILKMWEGLGYYSRVQNLQAGVREVVEKYGGIVPNTREEIIQLKGVGPYTAGAILSIAYGIPEHAVDGNVMRVLSRVLNISEDIALPKTKKIFEEAVMFLIDEENPSSFNQGLMELGATICTPTSPKCLLCPVREYCIAFHEGQPDKLPIKTKKTKMKHSYLKAFVIKNEQGHILMEKRSEQQLLANMWQFPLVEEDNLSSAINRICDMYAISGIKGIVSLIQFKHVFSHITWHIDVYSLECDNKNDSRFLSKDEIYSLPLPVPMQKILMKISE